ncbi:efflux transporter periplasmic adaptor subunit [Luteibacter rhizovicinus DSM 16549]|uniref:Efflux transporter periplasmic adaptor subunit n=1 Tax=Luteibacter rhizovicinus DSM 16549 TaxID=1440763 RepID=A0A0G9HFT7_9GAMM|nr:efflux RND transporter periplasmic adaptor subunit [Luteibacter rhizovicinus]APG05424.1 efflux transporter periplasmic adaptor subunit [Luteibacter rhizovicinus DSM 16549]KLD68044.1 RND transporter [Luteibacter rhizovicinus DSM 16549]KLD77263.1 RND transporter [Xanthomonas hyacinthi DSM 19077]
MKTIHVHVAALLLVLADSIAAEAAPTTSGALVLDARAMKVAGIVVDTLGRRRMGEELKAPGEVKMDAYATVLVSPRVASQVVTRKARLGDVVTKGQPLIVLSSVEVAETQGQLIVASQDWQRVSSLGPQAVSARRYGEALVQRDQARARLRAYGLTDGQVGNVLRRGSAAANGDFELIAPSAGRIVTDAFMVGERVEAGRVLFTVVTEDSVWVEARLSPSDAERVHDGAAVTVLAHGRELPGKMVGRSHQTDETTRRTDLRVQVANPDDLLHPGELVETRIAVGETTPRLAVPAEAVLLLRNQTTLFVQGNGAGRFDAVPVEVGETRGGWTEIRQGVTEGTAYVREGAFALKARILRSELGED